MIEEHIIRQRIKEKGLKATKQRVAIYRELHKLGHASAEDIVKALKDKESKLTIATVYNVLDNFSYRGIANKRYSPENKMFFDINTYPHAHFYDQDNQLFTDYNDPELFEMLNNYLANKLNDTIKLERIEINIVGTKIN